MALALATSVTMTPTDDGLVLLDERDGRYFQLNGTGATILRLLIDGMAPDAVAEQLEHRFHADPATAARDVSAFLGALRSAELVTS